MNVEEGASKAAPSAPPAEENEADPDDKKGMADDTGGDQQPLIFKYMNGLARILGIITIAILLWAAVDTVKHVESGLVPIEAYLIALCVLVIFFESLWFLDCLVCCQRQGACCKVWSIFLWFDTWKKGILYFGLSIPCFAIDVTVVLAIVGGVLLDATAIAYFCVAFTDCECCKRPLTAPPIVGHIEKTTDDLRASLVKHDENSAPPNTYDSTATSETNAPPSQVTEINEQSEKGGNVPQ